jgi:hypothetical protein
MHTRPTAGTSLSAQRDGLNVYAALALERTGGKAAT